MKKKCLELLKKINRKITLNDSDYVYPNSFLTQGGTSVGHLLQSFSKNHADAKMLCDTSNRRRYVEKKDLIPGRIFLDVTAF